MAILAECPICKKRQSLKNKLCSCGENLDQAKRSARVKFLIAYRLPGGKQRWEAVGFSLQEAKDADGKRKSQKREGKIFDMLPSSKITFAQLSKWYLERKHVKNLLSYERINLAFKNFNAVFGESRVNTILASDLEDYQERRKEKGVSPATIDMEISLIKTMINKAFDNGKVDGNALKSFRATKKLLKRGANARRRTLSFKEFQDLLNASPQHLKDFLIVALNSGMRLGEIRNLKYSNWDWKKGFIRLSGKETKEGREKIIPINRHVEEVLNRQIRATHSDFIFRYREHEIRGPQGLRKALKSSCAGAGIPFGRKEVDGLTFHDIRRTVKTGMLNAGVDKAHRDIILGHSMKGMDIHYIVADEEALKMAMAKYTAWLDEKMSSAVSHGQRVEKRPK